MKEGSTRRNRSISESVAALLLISIALSVGMLVYLAFLNTVAESQSALTGELMRAEASARQYLDILYVYYDSSGQRLEILVVSGAAPVNLYSVYVNKYLVADYGGAYTVRASSIDKLVIELPGLAPGQHLIEIIYGGGRAVYVFER